MLTFLTSVAIMLVVVGALVSWALREDRRRRARGLQPAERRSHAGDHR